MEGVLCLFQSAVLQSGINFSKAKNGTETATFILRKSNDNYRCILFDDGTSNGAYARMKKMQEKLKKGKVLNAECEMTLYERSMIPENIWNQLVKESGTCPYKDGLNPTKGKFPQFKVKDWDYAIPVEYYTKEKEKEMGNVKQIPENFSGFQNGGLI